MIPQTYTFQQFQLKIYSLSTLILSSFKRCPFILLCNVKRFTHLWQTIARCIFQLSRISSFQSHASRRDREYLSFGLVLRDESKIFSSDLVLRDENENFCLHSRIRDENKNNVEYFCTFVQGWLPFFSPVNN